MTSARRLPYPPIRTFSTGSPFGEEHAYADDLMSTPSEHLDVVVADDGSVNMHVPAEAVARLGAQPGEHLRLLRSEQAHSQPRKKVRGVLVGKLPAEEILTWEDFEAAHQANVEAAERRYGAAE